jgi:hypothetical protein
MITPGSASPLLAAGGDGYQISRSLRFNSADSAYLNRTFGTPTNNIKWTWSGWVKRGTLGTNQRLFGVGSDASGINQGSLYFGSADTVAFFQGNGAGATEATLTTTQVFRDPSAWYHIVFVYDSANATSSNRLLLYINGSQVTAFSSSTYPSSSLASKINANAVAHAIGVLPTSPSVYFNGYMTEVNFIDGQALTPSSFGQTNAQTGVWEPIKYTGTYGTNGFYLNFSDNSNTTAGTLGKDSSGNGLNWTPNGFSVTAGAGNDSLVDTPTPYGSDTGVGGEVRGNYATLNPIGVPYNTGTAANGNLNWTGATTADKGMAATISMASGKWYWECAITATSNAANNYVGIVKTTGSSDANANRVYIRGDGQVYRYGTFVGTYTSFTTNDIIGLAYDYSAQTLSIYKNNTLNVTISSVNLESHLPWVGGYTTTESWVANFGQRPFAYTAPSGFKALCTQNLPTPTIGATSTTQAGRYFDIELYTGTGSSRSVTGSPFQPDFVWIKGRSGATDNALYDAVRGVQLDLVSNSTAAETTQSTGLTAFNSDGFTVGSLAKANTNTATYVSWLWNAGGSNATNTSGTITSTVRANTTAGFSIVTFTAPASGGFTFGHGLGVQPAMFILKDRTNAGTAWGVWHKSLANQAQSYLQLNSTNAVAANANIWNNTAPTSSLISTQSGQVVLGSANSVCYVFAEVAGYSAFGSYAGNGSTDGTFVYTGFRPRFILLKGTGNASGWQMHDTMRDPYNAATNLLRADLSGVEGTGGGPHFDITSNGFKLRTTDTNYNNASYGPYIYAAFAENPFKYSLAR